MFASGNGGAGGIGGAPIARHVSRTGGNRSTPIFDYLARFDAFPKARDEAAEFFQRTAAGGIISIIAAVLMGILFLSELGIYASVRTENELAVDTSRGDTLEIHFDITMYRMPCAWFSLDAMDVSGDLHLDVEHDVFKRRLDARGNPISEHDAEKHHVGPSEIISNQASQGRDSRGKCGSCYGAEDPSAGRKCCNTCSEVREAYAAKGWGVPNLNDIDQCRKDKYLDDLRSGFGEGCQVFGNLKINKVAGNFHIAPGRSYQQGAMHMHDVSTFSEIEGVESFDFSHRINKLTFGQEYPGLKNPLDGVFVRQKPVNKDVRQNPKQGNRRSKAMPVGGSYQYYLKVVPTTYVTLANSTIVSNQYSVTEHYVEPQPDVVGPNGQLPGLFFFYDLSPIKVKYQEVRRPFLTFITSACAIIGGVFTISGIVDSTLFTAQRAVRKKSTMGKLI